MAFKEADTCKLRAREGIEMKLKTSTENTAKDISFHLYESITKLTGIT